MAPPRECPTCKMRLTCHPLPKQPQLTVTRIVAPFALIQILTSVRMWSVALWRLESVWTRHPRGAPGNKIGTKLDLIDLKSVEVDQLEIKKRSGLAHS